jgi:hypothetical protein
MTSVTGALGVTIGVTSVPGRAAHDGEGESEMKIDTTTPHIGRIYDYVLGGHHNYEADRQAAEKILQLVPSYPRGARLNRWLLQLVGSMWAEEGRRAVLDLGSGLPTQGHFDEYLPDARILFSDADPVSVLYGEQILGTRPNMKYVQADLRDPHVLLRQAAAFFGAERKLAIGVIGVVYFIPDDALVRLMKALHAFCAPGSTMALTFVVVAEDISMDIIRRGSELAKTTSYLRTAAQIAELIKPWRMREPRRADTWLGVEDTFSQDGDAVQVYGALADY